MFTALVLAANIAVFYFVNMQHPELLPQLALSSDTLHSPFAWISNAFVHANAMHLGMNMLFFAQIGFGTERYMGAIRFFWLYVLSGALGDVGAMLYLQNVDPTVMTVGASGAIFGVYAYSAFAGGAFTSFLLYAVLYHVMVFVDNMPVAWWAHAGGAAAGIVLALAGFGRRAYAAEEA